MTFDDFNDALRFIVQHCGGAKVVGSCLFGDKEPEAAGRYLNDCLNPGRAEYLKPDAIVRLLAMGNAAQCHEAMAYLCERTNYQTPDPIIPEEVRFQTIQELSSNVKKLMRDLHKLDPTLFTEDLA